jgi:hypothetical protein
MGRRMDFVEPGQLSVLLEIVGAATVVGAFLTGTCRLMPESPQRHGISNRPARVRRGKPDREELWAAFRLQFGVVGGRSRARVLGEALVLRRRRSCGCRRPDD